MKKVFTFVLAVFACATAYLTFSAFSSGSNNTISIFKSYKNHQPESVEIRFYRIGGRTFTMEGAINTTGTFMFTPKNTGQAYHCEAVLKSNDGFSTLFATANCNRITMEGVWYIESGTGIFADVEGEGKIMMGTSGCEVWEGTFR